MSLILLLIRILLFLDLVLLIKYDFFLLLLFDIKIDKLIFILLKLQRRCLLIMWTWTRWSLILSFTLLFLVSHGSRIVGSVAIPCSQWTISQCWRVLVFDYLGIAFFLRNVCLRSRGFFKLLGPLIYTNRFQVMLSSWFSYVVPFIFFLVPLFWLTVIFAKAFAGRDSFLFVLKR